MSDRTAIVTGASRGIGFAIAETLADMGYALTITARKPETLEEAAEKLRAKGAAVETVAGNMADEDVIKSVVDGHRERHGRLDVLVNNAGVGIGAAAADHETKKVDLQLSLNLRAIVLFYRECAALLREAGAEHKQAWVVNLASVAGKEGQAWLSVYSATKAGVISYTESMNKEFGKDGVRSVALCPGFVDTDMTTFVKDQIGAEEMIRPEDIGEAVRFVLALSPACVVPEIVFERPGGQSLG